MLAGNRRGRDYHVLLGNDLGHQLTLFPIELLAHSLGVATLVLRGVRLQIHLHELGPEALYLFLDCGPEVVGLHLGPESA